jgi:hypothetical protein
MITEKEIDYQIKLIQEDIQYFLNYKNQLKKFSINNRMSIPQLSMNKIFIEIETLTLYIQKLKNEEKEYLKLLNNIYYGNESDC